MSISFSSLTWFDLLLWALFFFHLHELGSNIVLLRRLLSSCTLLLLLGCKDWDLHSFVELLELLALFHGLTWVTVGRTEGFQGIGSLTGVGWLFLFLKALESSILKAGYRLEDVLDGVDTNTHLAC